MRIKSALTILLFFALIGSVCIAQGPPAPGGERPAAKAPGLKFQNATFEILLNDYAEKTGRTLLIDPKIPKGGSVTLRSQGSLTMPEYLRAIEAVLGMNGIGFVRSGEKFLKVVPIAEARKESLSIRTKQELPPDSEELISQLIPLKYIDIAEAEKAVKSFIHKYGQIQLFERTNSILLTDTAANINRVVEMLDLIDQPVVKLEEPHIIPIRFAKASEIKAKLEQIIAEAQGQPKKSTVPKQRSTGAPGVVRSSIPGVIRAPRAPTGQSEIETVAEIIEQAEKGLIRGEVKVIADDRTNILIIITRPENMVFFNKIIEVLDVETQPDVVIKVVRLEYASAEGEPAREGKPAVPGIVDMLNDLIGAKSKDNKTPQTVPGNVRDDASGAALREYVAKVSAERAAADKKSKVGELSADNIKILSDKRTNSLILMGSKGDVAAIEEIIKEMDTMLDQVMIEVIIVQVDLDDKVESGIHWIQRGLIMQQRSANGSLTPFGAVAGSAGAGHGEDARSVTEFIPSMESAAGLTSIGAWGQGAGLKAYFTFFDLNLDAVVRLLKSDTRSKIVSSPRVVATDNHKAIITSSEYVYFLKGNNVDQFGNVTPQVEAREVPLKLEVTPRINESRNVMMTILQEVEDISGSQRIEGQDWPITKKRSFTSDIAVRSGETIVLGGLVRRSKEKTKEGVPILSSIPLLGRLFSYTSDGERRSEIVVFITPSVLDTPEAIAANTKKHSDAIDSEGMWKTDWSSSKLAEKTRAHKALEKKEAKERAKMEEAILKSTQADMEKLPAPPPVVTTPEPVVPDVEPEPEVKTEPLPAEPEEKKPDEGVIETLDPELIDFINRQEKKWGKKLDKIDRAAQERLVE